MKRKYGVFAAVILTLGLLAAVGLAAGCGTNEKQLTEKYDEGYDAGVKAEQAKWSAEKLKLAQTYIKEQEDSQDNIVRLLKGDILNITIDAISVDDAAGRGKIEITANLRDGSRIKGVVDVVKIDSFWYIEKVTHTPS